MTYILYLAFVLSGFCSQDPADEADETLGGYRAKKTLESTKNAGVEYIGIIHPVF